MSEVQALSKKIKPFVLPLILIFICIFNIEYVIKGVKEALTTCAVSIIPSLFIFMVLSDITVSLLLEESTVSLPPKIIAFMLGSLCGFPIGAAVCDRLFINQSLSNEDAAKIIPFCNNASPAFVIGAIGVSMLGNPKLGWILFFSELLASFLPMLFIKTKNKKVKKTQASIPTNEVFFHAVENSVISILKICAIICFFSAIISMLKNTSLAFVSILLEISNGITYCVSLFEITPAISFALCGFCCGFSGICVHMQTKSAAKHININTPYLFICKLTQGALCFIFSLAGYYLFF